MDANFIGSNVSRLQPDMAISGKSFEIKVWKLTVNEESWQKNGLCHS